MLCEFYCIVCLRFAAPHLSTRAVHLYEHLICSMDNRCCCFVRRLWSGRNFPAWCSGGRRAGCLSLQRPGIDLPVTRPAWGSNLRPPASESRPLTNWAIGATSSVYSAVRQRIVWTILHHVCMTHVLRTPLGCVSRHVQRGSRCDATEARLASNNNKVRSTQSASLRCRSQGHTFCWRALKQAMKPRATKEGSLNFEQLTQKTTLLFRGP